MASELEQKVQMQLDKLNSATELINQYEFDLQRSRSEFKDLIKDCSLKMDNLRARLGLCIERSKPYYCAEILAAETSSDLEKKGQQLEKALSSNTAAKEMISLAEQGIGKQALDGAWQEMLNHAIGRVHETDVERETATTQYRCASLRHEAALIRMRNLHGDLKRSVLKSSYAIRRNLLTVNSIVYKHQLIHLPYYEMKVQFIDRIRKHKEKLDTLKGDICSSKLEYTNALKCLEEISDDVHRRRQSEQNGIEVDVSKLSFTADDLKLSQNMAEIVFNNAKFKEIEDNFIVLEELKNTKEKSCSMDWVCSQQSDTDDHDDIESLETRESSGAAAEIGDATNDSIDCRTAPVVFSVGAGSNSQSPKIKRKQSLDSVRDFLSTAVVNFNSSLIERRNSESKFFEINNISLPLPLPLTMSSSSASSSPSFSSSFTSLPMSLSSTITSSSFMRSFAFQSQTSSESTSLFDKANGLNGSQTRTLIVENDLRKICEKIFGESFVEETL